MRPGLIAFGLFLCAATTPAQSPYTATRIIGIGELGLTSFGSVPAISAIGQVAFTGRTATTNSVYRSDGQSSTLIHSNTSSWSSYSGLSVNADGAVTFYYNPSTTAGYAWIHTGNGGGPPAVVADGTATGAYTIYGRTPASNAGGTVAFFAHTAADGFAVFAGPAGGTVTTVAKAGPLFSSVGGYNSLTDSDDPTINSSGAVAFLAYSAANSKLGVYVASSGAYSLRAEAGGDLSKFSTPVLNDAGTAAFAAARSAGGSGIYKVDAAGNRTTVAVTGSAYSYFSDPIYGPFAPALNNSEKIAFLAGLPGGGEGIFTGPDPVADKVIAVGDALDGSTVYGLGFGRFGLNDSGQVAFWAALTDGRMGIYVLTPVPEPGTVLGLSALTLGVVRIGRRLRRRSTIAC